MFMSLPDDVDRLVQSMLTGKERIELWMLRQGIKSRRDPRVEAELRRIHQGCGPVIISVETELPRLDASEWGDSITFVCPWVEHIGHDWLRKWDRLERVDFAEMSSVVTVADDWLLGCSSLTSVNFRGMSSLLTVGDSWMLGCRSLTSVRFGGMSSLLLVGEGWLAICDSLATPSFEGLSSLLEGSSDWMFCCDSLDSGSNLFSITTQYSLSRLLKYR